MSKWKEYKLGDVAQLQKKTWKVGMSEMPYIALEHIVQGGLRINGLSDSSSVASNKYKFDSETFLFGKLRPYFRKLYKPNFDGICSTDIWVVKPKVNNDKDFLFYFFANQDFIDFSYSGASGTRMPRADWSFVSESKWMFPPLPEQKAIAEVLSSLDDKIDLLHRQNETLEKMAETLFRKWFVEDADDSWEEVSVSKYAEHSKISIKPNAKPITLFAHFSIPGYDTGKEPVYELGQEIKSNKYKVHQNSILFSKLNLHKVKRVWLILDEIPDNAICSTEFQVLKPHNENEIYFVYGLLTNSFNYREISSGVGGTSGSHQRISPNEIFSFPAPKVSKEILKRYAENVKPIFQKQANNQIQIRTLEKLRDTLLPKLISGEVRVEGV